jgi:hypothetical protein
MMITRDDVKKLLDEHKWLHDGGYGMIRDRSKTREELEAHVKLNQMALLGEGSICQIRKACDWIQSNIEPSKMINYKRTSYGMKHITEKETGYISNGEFITAALLCGYRMGLLSYNPSFNMKESSVKRAGQKVGMG